MASPKLFYGLYKKITEYHDVGKINQRKMFKGKCTNEATSVFFYCLKYSTKPKHNLHRVFSKIIVHVWPSCCNIYLPTFKVYDLRAETLRGAPLGIIMSLRLLPFAYLYILNQWVSHFGTYILKQPYLFSCQASLGCVCELFITFIFPIFLLSTYIFLTEIYTDNRTSHDLLFS